MIDYRALTSNYDFHPAIKRELADLLQHHNHRPARERRGSSVCSFRTMERRAWNLCSTLSDLHQIGFPITSLANLREKHIAALVTHWHAKGDTYGTVDNKLAYLRALLQWQRRPNLVMPLEKLWPDAATGGRNAIATQDKSWTGAQVDVCGLLAQIALTDQVVAAQLELQWSFGLRKSEAFLLRPVVALDEAVSRISVGVEFGTKGGRPRQVSLTDVSQVDVLVRCAALAVSARGTMIPPQYSLARWNNHYYHVLRTHGIVRDTNQGLGVTSHGLRHQYLQSRYEALTGQPAPVKGGAAPEPALLIAAMARVVSDAGHCALYKSQAYLGKLPSLARLGKLLPHTAPAMSFLTPDDHPRSWNQGAIPSSAGSRSV